jgi:serine phosphatase RsbU (regulator of sigma subunit)
MIKKILLLLFSIFIIIVSAGCQSENGNKRIAIKINAAPKDIKDLTNIFITGNLPELGEWDPGKIELEKQSDGIWSKTFYFTENSRLEFKFTRGSWLTQQTDEKNNDIPNYIFNITKDTIITIPIAGWNDMARKTGYVKTDDEGKAGFTSFRWKWVYHSGDSIIWRNPSYNDSLWESADPELMPGNFPKSGWKGIGWFRLWLRIDPALENQPLACWISQLGASEVYVDGKLKYTFGKVGRNKKEEENFSDNDPQILNLSGGKEHLIAVRYSSFIAEKYKAYKLNAGFRLGIGDLKTGFAYGKNVSEERLTQRLIFTAVPFALALIHFLLFVFYPKFRENLFYSLLMVGFAILGFFRNISNLTHVLIWLNIQIPVIILTTLGGLFTAYEMSYKKYPKRYMIYLLSGVAMILVGLFMWNKVIEILLDLYKVVIMLEILMCFMPSKSQNDKNHDKVNSGIMGFGAFALTLTILYDVAVSNNIIKPLYGFYGAYIFGALALSLAMLLQLSRKFAMVNTDLEDQIIHIKDLSEKTIAQERRAKEQEIARIKLEADNFRKTRELDEARNIQMKMLPKHIPDIPHLEIAVFMKTATEVGGDYYDFYLSDSGVLTTAIGDATGHGAKAGTMVAIAKSLFSQLAKENEILTIFESYTSVIKQMNFSGLYMSLTILKIDGYNMTISSAGMPPAYIYHSNDKYIEEILLKGMPLGSFSGFPYQLCEKKLIPGDVIILMSDGFPELFNPDNESIEYDRVKQLLEETGEKTPREIINRLSDYAETWANGRAQDDDVTFVVIKVK